MNFCIRSKSVITPEDSREAVIVIEDGKIKEILPYDAVLSIPVHDVGDLAVLPGIVDPHVHINEPGRTHWEGFDSMTQAAIAGGVTTLVDMPLNSSPVTTSVAAFKEKKGTTVGKLHCNVGFWGGLVPGNEQDIEALIEEGVLGFKGFLTHSGIDEFPNVTENDLRKYLPIIAKYPLPVLLHCELSDDDESWKLNDKRSYANYLSSRPPEWEDKAISLSIQLAEKYQCPIHIVHLSSSSAIELIRTAKEKRIPVTAETAQHYLFFCAEDIPDGATQFKCAPPIREKENNDKLWKALEEGVIDFVATDHSPAPPDLKHFDSGDFTNSWGGISSIQYAFSSLWTKAKERGFTLQHMAQWLSGSPARFATLVHKGRIQKGFDADLIVVDPDEKFTADEKNLLHKHKKTPYEGMELWGKVVETYVNGIKVFDNGKITATNKGKIISRQHDTGLS